jgi:hypothetical protein
MPITFDTLDELKEFYLAFNLQAAAGVKRAKPAAFDESGNGVEEPEEKQQRRGRRPQAVKAVVEEAPKKRGRVAGVRQGKAPIALKEGKSRKDQGETLTSKIQNAIQSFLDDGESFTANDVYSVLAKRNANVNKQSVITSVLKQMNGKFNDVSVTERPGNGPRPVKLYNAS